MSTGWHLLWIPAAGLLLIGCAKRVATPEAPSRSSSAAAYYPLAVGNRWTYQRNFLGEQRVERVEILKEERGYFIDSQGGELTTDALGVRDHHRYLLREPIEVGNSWTNILSVSSVEHYRIVDVGPCEAPAGKFEACVRVEGRNRIDEGTTLVNELTFAPGTGIVRLQLHAETQGGRIPLTQLVLVRFDPAVRQR